MRTTSWRYGLLLAGLLAVGACNKKSPVAPAPSGPTVTAVTVTGSNTLNVGATVNMAATATMSDSTMISVTNSATWQSSNTAVATVSSAGAVKGVAPGTSTISATYLSIAGQLMVQVNAVDDIQKVTISLDKVVIDGTCDNDSIFEDSKDGEFVFDFELDRSGVGGSTQVWGIGETTYTKGSHSVSGSYTFPRNVTKGENFGLTFFATEYDGLLGADTKLNGKGLKRTYNYANGAWSPSSRSLSVSGGSECGATLQFAISSVASQ